MFLVFIIKFCNNSEKIIINHQLLNYQGKDEEHRNDKNNPHNVTKEQLGLGNVDNTSDMDKPISNDMEEAFENVSVFISELFDTDISMKNNRIENLAQPINDNDAASKKYVDDLINSEILALRYLMNDISPPVQTSLGYTITQQNYTIENNQAELKDISGNNNHLTQSDQSKQPALELDDKNRSFLKFDNSVMNATFESTYICSNENITSFMLIAKTHQLAVQMHFRWIDDNKEGKIRAHLPYSDGVLYIDNGILQGDPSTYLLSVGGQPNVIGNIESYFYERNGSTARLYRNGTNIVETTTLSSRLPESNGRFIVGARNNDLKHPCKMDLYALFIWNRQLSDSEKQQMFDYSKKRFGFKTQFFYTCSSRSIFDDPVFYSLP